MKKLKIMFFLKMLHAGSSLMFELWNASLFHNLDSDELNGKNCEIFFKNFNSTKLTRFG